MQDKMISVVIRKGLNVTRNHRYHSGFLRFLFLREVVTLSGAKEVYLRSSKEFRSIGRLN